MAHRRMINQEIVDTDLFAEMPQSSRYLYYELLIRADDDGFLGAPMRIVRMVECTETDLNNLIDKGYVIKFESGIIVIRDWKIHNNVRKDMYKETIYQSEFNMLCEVEKRYYLRSECDVTDNVTCNVTNDVTDNVTLGKVSKGKVREGKDSTFTSLTLTLQEGDAHPPSAGAGGAHTFTLTDVQQCVEDNDIDLSDKGITAFYKWMEKYDWKINKRKVTKLENALSGYARKHPEYSLAQEEPEEPEPVTPSKYLETFKTWLRYHDYADGGEGDFSEEISISDEVIDTIFEVEDMNEPVSQINDRLCDQFGEKEVSPFMELFRKWAKEKKYDNLRRRNGKE